jgi:hypothetical protein
VLLSLAAGQIHLFDQVSSFSQARYYYSISTISLFWFLATGFSSRGAFQLESLLTRASAGGVILALLVFEFQGRAFWRATDLFPGLRAALRQSERVDDSLAEALSIIREQAEPGEAILVDYVPQYVNWYLPGYRVALIPDRTARTPLNADNPLMSARLREPEWHLWFPSWGSGFWSCVSACDQHVERIDWKTRSYLLRSDALGRELKFCIVQTWESSPWDNAPFRVIDNFDAEFKRSGMLALARRCD